MGESFKNILIIIAYFFVAILLFGSMGIWLPFLIDDYNLSQFSEETYRALPSNLLTYSLGIFLIASIDRMIFLLFRTSKYSNNVLEFFAIIFAIIGVGVLVFFSLKSIKNSLIEDAVQYAKYLALSASLAWFYVKLQGSKANNFSPLGGIV